MKSLVEHLGSSLSGSESKIKQCITHGEYLSRYMPCGESKRWTICPYCHIEQVKREGLEAARELESNRKSLILNRLKSANLPSKYVDSKFNDLIAQNDVHAKHVDTCRRFARNFKKALASGSSLLLYGNSGTGKTHLAYSVVGEVIEQGYTTATVKAKAMLGEIKDQNDFKIEGTEHDKIMEYSKPDLLVIDELNGPILSDRNNIERIFDVVDERYNQTKCTILISNASFKKHETTINDLLCPRTRDRLIDNGGKLLAFEHDSWRRNEKKASFMFD